MGGYPALPVAWARTPSEAAPWIERAMLEVATLPPRQPKAEQKRGGT
jgi:hypothetical protein